MAYAIEKLQDAHSKNVREANHKYEKDEKQTQIIRDEKEAQK